MATPSRPSLEVQLLRLFRRQPTRVQVAIVQLLQRGRSPDRPTTSPRVRPFPVPPPAA